MNTPTQDHIHGYFQGCEATKALVLQKVEEARQKRVNTGQYIMEELAKHQMTERLQANSKGYDDVEAIPKKDQVVLACAIAFGIFACFYALVAGA